MMSLFEREGSFFCPISNRGANLLVGSFFHLPAQTNINMKYFIPFILFLLFTTSCEYATQQANNFEDPPQQELLGYEVAFEVSTDDPEDLEIFEDGVIPWISIKEPEKVWDKLEGKEEVVIKENEAILFLDYPLSKDLKLPIKADSTAGFTRGELILIISRNYKRIYTEEEASAEVKTIPLEKRE